MIYRCVLSLLVLLLMPASLVLASPALLTYQGRIVKDDGTPLEHSAVSFIFQITDPSGACIIYQEQINGYSMVNSKGVFDVPIGQGTVTYPTSGSFTVLDAFKNSQAFVCQGGAPYNSGASDARKLRVQFYDGVGWKTISPDSVIRSVPFAGYAVSAQKLGDHVAADFLMKAGLPTCSVGTFLSWSGSNLTCESVAGASGGTVTNVTSTNAYLTVASGTTTPALTLNVGTAANTVAAGNDSRLVNALQSGATAGGDLSGSYPNPTVAKINGTALSMSALTSGQILKYDGTNWINATLAISDIANLTTQLSNKLDQSKMPANCAANQTLTFSSPTGFWNCSDIAITGAAFGSQSANTVLVAPNGAAGNPTFRALTTADLPANAYDSTYFKNNGNSFGATATLGTSDNNALEIKTNNSTRLTVNASGNVGVGTTSPAASLDVVGNLNLTNTNLTLPAPGSNGIVGQTSNSLTLAPSGNYTTGIQFVSGIENTVTASSSTTATDLSNLYLGGSRTSITYMAPAPITQVLGSQSMANINTASAVTTVTASNSVARNSGTGTVVNLTGQSLGANNQSTGTVTNAYGLKSSINNYNAGGTITNAYGLYTTTANVGTITNSYGLYINDVAGTNTWGIYENSTAPNYFAGNIGIGTTSPSVALDIGSKTDALRLPNGTTAQQPSSPTNGMIRYNTTTNFVEAYQNGAWVSLTTSAGGSNVTTNGSGAVTISAGGTNQNVTLQSSGTGVVTSPSIVTITNSTASTAPNNGALVVSGGVGVSGDLNTGGNIYSSGSISSGTSLYSPIIYGSSAASGTLTLDSTSDATKGNILLAPNGGLIGIGTTTPTNRVDVVTSSANNEVIRITNSDSTSSNAQASFQAYNDKNGIIMGVLGSANTLTGFGAPGDSYIYNAGGTSDGTKNLNIINNQPTGKIRFFNGSTANGTMRMMIDSTGNVGIGTTTPAARLDIAYTPTPVSGNIDSAVNSLVTESVTANGTYYTRGVTSKVEKKINSGVTDSGYMIGSWSQPFRNNYGSADNGTLSMMRGSVVQYGHYNFDPAATPITTTAIGLYLAPYYMTGTITNLYDIYIAPGSGGGTVTNGWSLYQASARPSYFAGNIGVGTAAPQASLHLSPINTAGTQEALRISDQGSGANEGGWIQFDSSGKPDQVRLGQLSSATGSNFVISTNSANAGTPTERLRVDPNGYVGLGNSSPTYKIDILGSGYAASSIKMKRTDVTGIGPGTDFYTAADATESATSQTVANKGLGQLNFYGTNETGASAPIPSARISAYTSENTTTTATGGSLRFQTTTTGANALTEVMRLIDGKVGIGTTAPTTSLDMGNTFYSGTPTTLAQLINKVSFWNNGTTPNYGLGVSTAALNITAGESGARIAFHTGGANERMRIDSAGNIGIGTTAPGYKLDVQGGGVNASAGYTQTSDIRLKTNVEYLQSKDSLEKISSLRGIHYDWKDQAKLGADRQIGLIAQDVEKVFPEAVKKNSEGFLSVSYSNLVAPVIEAIKELFKTSERQARMIASVQAENEKLKQENAEIKARLEKIEKVLSSKDQK